MLSISERLEMGADILERTYWWRGSYDGAGSDRNCILTSMSTSSVSFDTEKWMDEKHRAWEFLAQAIEELTGHQVPSTHIVHFNDVLAESKEQCLEVMRYAAKLAREEESIPAIEGGR